MSRKLGLLAAELVIVSLAVLALVSVLHSPGARPAKAHVLPAAVHAVQPSATRTLCTRPIDPRSQRGASSHGACSHHRSP